MTTVPTTIRYGLDLNALLAGVIAPTMSDGSAPGPEDSIANPLSGQNGALAAFLNSVFVAGYGTSGLDPSSGVTITAQARDGIEKLMIPNSSIDNVKILAALDTSTWKDHLFTVSQLTEVLTDVVGFGGKITVDGANSDQYKFSFAAGDSLGSLVNVSTTAGTSVSQDYWRLELVQS